MVSLTMMARLLEAVRPESRLVLVGDPDQLASVEAGAVLADLVEGLDRSRTPRLSGWPPRTGSAPRSAHWPGDPRWNADAAIEVLAAGEHIEWLDTGDASGILRKVAVPHALQLREAAVLGTPSRRWILDEHRLLCAHRRGPYG